jgi:GNAT superfamily N-acetyltransferase
MELLPGYRMHPPRDEDAEAVAAFSNEETLAVLGVPVLSADWLRDRWTAPGAERDLDFAVVESPEGELCGFLSVEAEPPFTEVFALGIVAPAFHGRGLGAAIAAENERRAGRFAALADPKARVVVHAGSLADEPRVSALLASRGYREVRRFELRRVDFTGEPAPPGAVEGISVRGFRPEEARQLYEAHVDAFAHHFGEGEETYEDFSPPPPRRAVVRRGALVPRVGRRRDRRLRRRARRIARGLLAGIHHAPGRAPAVPPPGSRGGAPPPGIRGTSCPRQAGRRPARRHRFAHRRNAPVRPGGHDRPASLRHVGEGAAARGRVRTVASCDTNTTVRQEVDK